jgi:hypothetical protein
MFYGHIGVALAAKPLAPKVSVGVQLIGGLQDKFGRHFLININCHIG